MHSTSLLELLKEFRGQNVQNFVPSTLAYAFAQSLIFQNENFGFGLMSKIQLQSYTAMHANSKLQV